jgi:hypothetical protein
LDGVPGKSLFVQKLGVSGDSSRVWDVTPPTRLRFFDLTAPISVRFQFSQGLQKLEMQTKRVLTEDEDEQLKSVLNGSSQSMLIERLYPIFQHLQVGPIFCSLRFDSDHYRSRMDR